MTKKRKFQFTDQKGKVHTRTSATDYAYGSLKRDWRTGEKTPAFHRTYEAARRRAGVYGEVYRVRVVPPALTPVGRDLRAAREAAGKGPDADGNWTGRESRIMHERKTAAVEAARKPRKDYDEISLGCDEDGELNLRLRRGFDTQVVRITPRDLEKIRKLGGEWEGVG